MRWAAFQAIIVFAVVASNIHWKWTPNTYLASTLGFVAALLATLLVNWLWLRIQTWRVLRTEKRPHHR